MVALTKFDKMAMRMATAVRSNNFSGSPSYATVRDILLILKEHWENNPECYVETVNSAIEFMEKALSELPGGNNGP